MTARVAVSRYLAAERPHAAPAEPLFCVKYETVGSKVAYRRMDGGRVYKILKALGEAHGIPNLSPHVLRHAFAVELLRRSKNLAAVQQHLRHADPRTTTVYARMLPHDMQEIAKSFDREALTSGSSPLGSDENSKHATDEKGGDSEGRD